MSRRMIDPQVIIKSQIVDDGFNVDLNEILEKYGTQNNYGDKSVTLQFYSKQAADDAQLAIVAGAVHDNKGIIMPNTAITITKYPQSMTIRGLIVDNLSDMNFLPYIEINEVDYEADLFTTDYYAYDIHVVKV